MSIYKLGTKKMNNHDFKGTFSYIPVRETRDELFILCTECNQIYLFSGKDKDKFQWGCLQDRIEMVTSGYEVLQEESAAIPDEKKSFTACLNLAHDCNLRCRYCYASGGSYRKERSVMPPEIAVDALRWAINHFDMELLNVIFFGGEPLLNYKAIEAIKKTEKEWSNQKNVEYAITTNGTMLSDELYRLFDNQINVTVSMDGPTEKDNELRVFPNGENAYSTIIDNLNGMQKKNQQHTRIRMTVADGYRNIVDKIARYIEQGFMNINIDFIYSDDISFYNNIDLDYVKQELDELAKMSIDVWMKKGVVINPYVKNFKKLICGITSPKVCTAGEEMVSITPDGTVYPCFKYINDDWILGNIYGERQHEKYDEFVSLKKEIKKKHCGYCKMFSMCGGTCIKEYDKAFFTSGLLCEISKILCNSSLNAYIEYWIKNHYFIKNYIHLEKAYSVMKKHLARDSL